MKKRKRRYRSMTTGWNPDPSYADLDNHPHGDLVRRLFQEARHLDEGGWGLPDRMRGRWCALFAEAGINIYNAFRWRTPKGDST